MFDVHDYAILNDLVCWGNYFRGGSLHIDVQNKQ